MELQSYRLYIIDRACGHTEAYRTPTALTRQQIYQMEAETCSKCQKTQNTAIHAARKTDSRSGSGLARSATAS